MITYSEIYKEIYEAFLKAIESTGDSYKGISWFGRNKRITPPRCKP